MHDNDKVIETIAEAFPDETEFFVIAAADMERIRAAIEAAGGKDALGLSGVLAVPLTLEQVTA